MSTYKLLGIVGLTGFMLASQQSLASSVSSYMIVTTLAPGLGDAFAMSDSEIGAIGVNSTTSPPGSLPALPGGTTRTVSAGVTLDGDVAVTNGGTVTFSNSDVHAMNNGPLQVGSQGVDCSASYNTCTDNGTQISSSNQFNKSLAPSFSALADNNGIQGGIDHSGVLNQLGTAQGNISGAVTDAVVDLSGTAGGKVENDANAVWDFSGDGIVGTTIIDISTGGSDFSIVNSNLTIKGDAGDTLIFRVDAGSVMAASQSNLLLDGGIGDNNVLFYVDADNGEESFNFNNVTFYGMSMWDLDSDPKNVANFNNVQFCGQVITDQVNFQNVSGSGCSFDTSVVPLPAAAWLFASALGGLIMVKRRKA